MNERKSKQGIVTEETEMRNISRWNTVMISESLYIDISEVVILLLTLLYLCLKVPRMIIIDTLITFLHHRRFMSS